MKIVVALGGNALLRRGEPPLLAVVARRYIHR
jgi:carbamate kinase